MPAVLILVAPAPAGAVPVWYADFDADAWGDISTTMTGLVAPVNFTALRGDCDDSDAGTRYGAIDIADGQDNNCNGVVDEPNSVIGPLLDGGNYAVHLADHTVSVGNSLLFNITTSDGGLGGNVSFGAGAFIPSDVIPVGASFTFGAPSQNQVGTFSWTPTIADIGLHKFEVYAGFSDTFLGINAGWGLITVQAAVPVPAAVWLFGSGLFGLLGLSRRKSS